MKVAQAIAVVALLVAVFTPGHAQDADAPRPIAAIDSVWMEEMTWMEIRDAMREGKTTALILTGGVEANGPYVPTGKHNYILEATGEGIARGLGDALVVPILRFEPGRPAESASPGSVVFSPETYRAVLEDMAVSLKTQGFRNVVLMGDSGGNQRPMEEVTEKLAADWAGGPTRIVFVRDYYATKRIIDEERLPAMGIRQEDEGLHDSYRINSVLMARDPSRVRYEQRVAAGLASINGISIDPPETTIEIGRKNLDFRIRYAVEAIRKALEEASARR